MRSTTAALAAAQDLLVEGGWSAVTHVTVAARSGVGRSTLYRHWPDITELVREAIAARITRARPDPVGELRADLLGQLEGLRQLLHDPVSERAMRTVIERADVDDAFARLKELLYRAGVAGFVEIIDGARSRGELPSELDTDRAVDLLVGPLFFRRLLAGRTFDSSYTGFVVDDFLARHRRATSR